MEISYKQGYSQTELLSRPPVHLEVGINTYQLRKRLIWKAGVKAFIGIWQWSSGLHFEWSQACESHHNSNTWDAEAQAGSLTLMRNSTLEVSSGPSLMKEQPLHLSHHCHFLPGGTTSVNTMKQHQKTDRQSKWCESNIVITTPCSQLLTSMSLLVGIQLRSCRATHCRGNGWLLQN